MSEKPRARSSRAGRQQPKAAAVSRRGAAKTEPKKGFKGSRRGDSSRAAQEEPSGSSKRSAAAARRPKHATPKKAISKKSPTSGSSAGGRKRNTASKRSPSTPCKSRKRPAAEPKVSHFSFPAAQIVKTVEETVSAVLPIAAAAVSGTPLSSTGSGGSPGAGGYRGASSSDDDDRLRGKGGKAARRKADHSAFVCFRQSCSGIGKNCIPRDVVYSFFSWLWALIGPIVLRRLRISI